MNITKAEIALFILSKFLESNDVSKEAKAKNTNNKEIKDFDKVFAPIESVKFLRKHRFVLYTVLTTSSHWLPLERQKRQQTGARWRALTVFYRVDNHGGKLYDGAGSMSFPVIRRTSFIFRWTVTAAALATFWPMSRDFL